MATDLHFLGFDAQPGSTLPRESEASVAAALPNAEAVTLVPRPRQEKRWLQLQTMLRGRSYGFQTHADEPMVKALMETINVFEPDLLHCDDLVLGNLARLAPTSIVRVMALHNVESRLMMRMATTTHERLRKMLYMKEAELLRQWEVSHLAEFDLCLGVSNEDANYCATLGANAVCVPNGVNRHPTPPPPTALNENEPLKLLFVGSGSWEPNRVGMAWFVKNVLPAIDCRVDPQVTVIGSNWDWLDHPLCRLVGHVPLLDDYYSSHHVALAPFLSGGGSRLKVVEALAKGLPLVGTSIGLEGYSLQPNVHALFGDTPDQFAMHIQDLDYKFRADIEAIGCRIKAGFLHAEQFLWEKIGKRLVSVYIDEVARQHEDRPNIKM